MQKQQRAKAGMKPPTQRYSRMGKRSRKDKKEFIRSLALLLALLAGSASARMVVVPPQPMSPYADTEVSTNIPFSASSEHAREIEMRFALDGCMSNCVQVAFGKDADGDGFTNLEEFTAKTDPRDKLSHPDYMDYLALAGAVQDTRLDFYFKEAMKLPSGYRFRFQRLSRKDRNSSATYTALMDGEIATDEVNEKLREKSGWKVVGYEQKEEKMKIAGSQLTKNVDSSTVEIQRLSDGRKVKLVIVPNVKQFRNRVETDLESRIDIVWNRGDGLKFTVSEGTEFSIKERKYRVTKLKKTENGAEVTVQDLASKTEKILR